MIIIIIKKSQRRERLTSIAKPKSLISMYKLKTIIFFLYQDIPAYLRVTLLIIVYFLFVLKVVGVQKTRSVWLEIFSGATTS